MTVMGLIDHLWQCTLFAGAAWLFARALSRSRARVRFWIWFTASLKFLVPFAFLSTLGTMSASRFAPATALPTIELPRVMGSVLSPAMSMDTDGGKARPFIGICFLVWSVGAVALTGRWWLRWRRVRRIVASGVEIGSLNSLPMLMSPLVSEPGVAGILRPVLLLPEGMPDRLSAGQLRAVLAHEFCHVRHRDNFLAALHGLVEVVFWVHPLVWWIGGRLIEERERACDEEVVRGGHSPQTYAEAILNVCRSSVTGEAALVAGVTGADLMARLEAIMKDDVENRLSAGKKWMLAVAATAALGLPVVVGLRAPLAHADSVRTATAGKIELLPGKRVRLNFDHVDVRSLLQSLAEAAGVNMLVSDKVGGEVTVHLAEMPWEQALNVVLKSQGISKRESDGVIVVEPSAASAAG